MMTRPLVIWSLLSLFSGTLAGAEWYAAVDGRPDAAGTRQSPWDLTSALAGGQKIAAGDTLWLLGGTYRHPDRARGSRGYVVRLAGRNGAPVEIRAAIGERVTLDGGLAVDAPSDWLHIRDLEILVSENLTQSRRFEEPGSHPASYDRPWGGLNIHAGSGCKYINLVIHDNAQGVSFWSGASDSDLYGAIIYDNGWDAPDRGHGHAVYTQNERGTKTIADCIMTGGYSYTMHAYGSSRAYVDNYSIEGNIAYRGGPFLVGGGRPSRDIRVLNNALLGVDLRIGYNAPHNENCIVRGNAILGGRLSINNYRQVDQADNLVIDPGQMDSQSGTWSSLRVNRYAPQRAHLAVVQWSKEPLAEVAVEGFLSPGDSWRLVDPRDFYGPPLASGTYQGGPLRLPVTERFTAFVLFKG